MRGIGGNCASKLSANSVRLLHHPRLRIAGAHPHLTLGLSPALRACNFCNSSSALSSRCCCWRRARAGAVLASIFGPLPSLRDLPSPPPASRRSRCSRTSPPGENSCGSPTPKSSRRLASLAPGISPSSAQRRQHLREQFIQLLSVLPHETEGCDSSLRLTLSATGTLRSYHSAGRLLVPSQSPATGVHPQTDEQLRIERWPPAFSASTLDGSIKRTQVQAPHQCPNGSRRMAFAESLYIHGSPTHLLSIHVADQGLLVGDIFFAHAASLRRTFCFARRKFGGVSSQLRYRMYRLHG